MDWFTNGKGDYFYIDGATRADLSGSLKDYGLRWVSEECLTTFNYSGKDINREFFNSSRDFTNNWWRTRIAETQHSFLKAAYENDGTQLFLTTVSFLIPLSRSYQILQSLESISNAKFAMNMAELYFVQLPAIEQNAMKSLGVEQKNSTIPGIITNAANENLGQSVDAILNTGAAINGDNTAILSVANSISNIIHNQKK